MVTEDKIREMIAQSGKLTVREALAYVMSRYPDANKALVRSNAKEMIAQAKEYIRRK